MKLTFPQFSAVIASVESSMVHICRSYRLVLGIALVSSLALFGGNAALAQRISPGLTISPAPACQGWLNIAGKLTTGCDASINNINVNGSLSNSSSFILGTSYTSQNSAIYNNVTASGSITGTNTLLLPSGPTWPILYDTCSDTILASGGSQNNPRIATCKTIYMNNIGIGTGDRAALGIEMTINGTTTQTEGDTYYNGVISTIQANSNIGGILGAEIGDVYGLSTQITLNSGATHYASVHDAGEWDLQVKSGASVANKIGAEISLLSGDAVQGSNIDAAILLTDRGITNWNYGIEFGLPSGQGGSFPISGTIIGSYVGGNTTFGIDLHNITFSNASLSLPGFTVFGNGHIGSANMPTTSIPSLSSCGVGATTSAGSTDNRGIINTGTGVFTTCTVTFGGSFSSAPGGVPNCIVQPTGNYTLWLTSFTATGMVINFSTSSPSTSVIYHCWD